MTENAVTTQDAVTPPEAAGAAAQQPAPGRDLVDPELGVNVVDLGLVYGVTVAEDNVATIDMTLTSAACPLTDVIEDQTRAALEGLVADFRINWVWLPPWGPDKITDDGREQLRAMGFNV
jgi:metal-sulfur cluster biosynthetic enzyme